MSNPEGARKSGRFMASARKSEVARLRSATYSPEASSACVSSIDFGKVDVGINRFIFRHLPKRC